MDTKVRDLDRLLDLDRSSAFTGGLVNVSHCSRFD